MSDAVESEPPPELPKSAPEEPPVEIHKPHAAKTWKEFFIELGTIVAGILIALGLEQTVETTHNHSRTAQARQTIHVEVSHNIGFLVSRARIESCVSRRLDEVEGLVAAVAAGKLSQGPIWLGHPPTFPIATGQYTAASQSGAVSLLSNQEQADYATIYATLEEQNRASAVEQAAWADLRMLEKHPAGSPALDLQLRSALQKARLARWQIETSAAVGRGAASRLGITPDETFHWTQQSSCIPLNTERAEAEKLVVNGRIETSSFDEP